MKDRDFSPRLLGLREDPPGALPRLMVGLVALLFIGLLLWSIFGRLNIVARATGKLVPESRVQVVQPLDGGRVAEILVEEGQHVAAGEPLIRMDPRFSAAELARYREQLTLARLQRRRIEATLADKSFTRKEGENPALYQQVHAEFVSERRAYRHSIERQKATLERTQKELASAHHVRDQYKEALALAKEYERTYAELGKQQAVARFEILDQQRARIEAATDLASQEQRIDRLKGQIREARAELARMESERRQRLVSRRNKLSSEIAALEANWQKQHIRNGLLELRAPRAGIVKNLAVHTEGSVTPSGTELLSIVPKDEPLRAEVLVSNSDIGFVHVGQQARVKLSAYPFQRFGTVEGTIEMVSPDAQSKDQKNQFSTRNGQSRGQGGYTARIVLDRQQLTYEGEKLDLRPGMQVVAEVDIGTRSVLDYVVSPVAKTLDYAGKEK